MACRRPVLLSDDFAETGWTLAVTVRIPDGPVREGCHPWSPLYGADDENVNQAEIADQRHVPGHPSHLQMTHLAGI